MQKIECQVYSRVCGYITPVQAWNKGKTQEFGERVNFALPEEVQRDDGQHADCERKRAE